ncbi:MAG: flavin reductase family protein [Dehalococcoidia bacterium]
MAKKVTERMEEFYHYYPTVPVVITAHAGDRDNAMAAAWHSPISRDPPLYGVSISPKRFTWGLVLESGEFGINFLPLERAQLIAEVGGSKGQDIDKFEAFGITREKAIKTRVPLLRDAYAAYECRVVDHKTWGDHEWVVGEIVAVHVEEEAFTQEHRLNLNRLNPALYLGQDLYVAADKDSLRYVERPKG